MSDPSLSLPFIYRWEAFRDDCHSDRDRSRQGWRGLRFWRERVAYKQRITSFQQPFSELFMDYAILGHVDLPLSSS